MDNMSTIPDSNTKIVAPPPHPFDVRMSIGLVGVLLAAMMAGLNGRIPSLVLIDIQGGVGFSKDSISWLTTAYSAGELTAMPFATWFAITFSIRRFHLIMLLSSMFLSILLPFVQDLQLLILLRFIHGIASGSLIPLLMTSLLRFMPLSIRLYGLAIFALVATFTPNIALWLASWCVDHLEDWRWVYWHVVLLGFIAIPMVAWGIPKMPSMLSRLQQANWFSLLLGIPGLTLLVIGIDQGVRLDWFHSPIIIISLSMGTLLTILFLLNEVLSKSPSPFVQLKLLQRRNVGLGLPIFFFVFMLFVPGVTLPANILGNLQGFRMEQSLTLGLMVGLPQLILGPCVAYMLFQKWADPRYVFSVGLIFIAIGCGIASNLTSNWMVEQFIWAEILQMIGQPLALVPLLFLITSVVDPMEGPYIAGLINILRVISTTIASAIVGQLSLTRSHFHSEILLDNAGRLLPNLPQPNMFESSQLGQIVVQQAATKASADIYLMFCVVALLLIPVVLKLQYVSPPEVKHTKPKPSVALQNATLN